MLGYCCFANVFGDACCAVCRWFDWWLIVASFAGCCFVGGFAFLVGVVIFNSVV